MINFFQQGVLVKINLLCAVTLTFLFSIIWPNKSYANNEQFNNSISAYVLSESYSNILPIKQLFLNPKLTSDQFEWVKKILPSHGDWTKKFMVREELMKRLKLEPLTDELFEACMNYKKEFEDNRLIESIIHEAAEPTFLLKFETEKVGKRIKTLAKNKLKKLAK